jgi:hypothetical protein
MGVPTSEVGYTTAMPRREDHEVYKDMWWHWIKKMYLYKQKPGYFAKELKQFSMNKWNLWGI